MRHLPMLLLAPFLGLAAPASAQSFAGARWIWSEPPPHAQGARCTLRAELELAAAPRRAVAAVTADNRFRLRVNGAEVARGDDWTHAARLDLTSALRAGTNVIEAACTNDGSIAGFLFAADVEAPDGARVRIVSDASWRAAPQPPAGRTADGPSVEWGPVHELGVHGCAPWGEIAEPRPAIVVDPLPGFRVSPVVEGIGSIDAFTRAGRGRWIASVEGLPLLELVDRDGDGATETHAVLTDLVRECQGLLWRGDSLYATGDGPAGHALYRVTPGKDGAAPASVERIVALDGDLGEHGPHAVIEGPDGALYVMVGNHARLATPPAASSPYRITYEGHLLPCYVDPRGHAVDCKAPGGFVLRVDPDAGTCELFCAGFRNAYDFAFDARGELFTFDSDMEWDVGLPWYRPCRLLHLVPGGEYGWRTGSKVWPESYADSLPPLLDTGRGSPTGMTLCTGDRFPERFRGAILAGDWSLGQILAFRLEPRGASYVATSEILLRGRPLNVTDLEMDEDGSLLFSVGGRGTQGGLHRLAYEGTGEGGARTGTAASAGPTPARTARFDGSTPVARLIDALADADRFVRFEASLALEQREPASWETAALAHPSALARGAALVALARAGIARTEPERHAPRLEAALALLTGGATPGATGATASRASGASGAPRLIALRAIELLLLDPELATTRTPALDPKLAAKLGPPLLALFPTGERAADRELAQLVAFLAPEGAAAKLFTAFTREPSREQRIALAYSLRCVRGAWPEGARLEVCRWLDRGIASGSGGMSFEGYLRRLRDDVAAGLTDAERAELAAEAAAAASPQSELAAAATSEPRDLDRTLQVVERTLRSPRRSLPDGGLVFKQLCASCHRRFELGAAVGPDLTTVGSRFGLRDLLESMLAPERAISDQYRGLNVFLKDGDVKSGLPLLDDGRTIVLVEGTGRRVEIAAQDVASKRPSTTSVMPAGMLDGLTLELIADLCAWLLADSFVEPAAEPGWRTLFDGRALAGFEGDLARWRVEDGAIAGSAAGLTAPSDLIAAGARADFTIEFELRLGAVEADSGFLFRASRAAPDRLAGYEADAGGPRFGALRDAAGERGALAVAKNEIWRTLADPLGWNHVVVTARGDRVAIEVNGDLAVDLVDPGGPKSGLLGFRLEPGGRNDVRLRHVRLKE